MPSFRKTQKNTHKTIDSNFKITGPLADIAEFIEMEDGTVEIRMKESLKDNYEKGLYPQRALEKVSEIAKGTTIGIFWSIEDVIEIASKANIDLSDDEAKNILRTLKLKHDCNDGITNEVIQITVDKIVRER